MPDDTLREALSPYFDEASPDNVDLPPHTYVDEASFDERLHDLWRNPPAEPATYVPAGDERFSSSSAAADHVWPKIAVGERADVGTANAVFDEIGGDLEDLLAETADNLTAELLDLGFEQEDFAVYVVQKDAQDLLRWGLFGMPYTRGHCDRSISVGAVTMVIPRSNQAITVTVNLDWETGELTCHETKSTR